MIICRLVANLSKKFKEFSRPFLLATPPGVVASETCKGKGKSAYLHCNLVSQQKWWRIPRVAKIKRGLGFIVLGFGGTLHRPRTLCCSISYHFNEICCCSKGIILTTR